MIVKELAHVVAEIKDSFSIKSDRLSLEISVELIKAKYIKELTETLKGKKWKIHN